MILYQPAAMESYTLTIADSERLKNGKAFLCLVALLCTVSLLGHAVCCGSYGNNVVESCELVVEGGGSSIQPNAVMVAAQDINSTGLADYGRFELSSICSVVNHIIGRDDSSFYMYKPFCVISRLGPVEVTSIWIGDSSEHVNKMYIVTMPDDSVIGSWKTEVIDSDTLELVFSTGQLGTHQSMWVTEKNWCQEPIIMQLILNSEEVVDECRFPKPIPFWSRLKKIFLVAFIMIFLVSCVVLPQLIENGRISSASVPKLVGKASYINFKFGVLASSGANGLSGPIGEPDTKMIESLSNSSSEEPEHDPCSGNDTSIPEKRDTIVTKEKSSRKRRKRRSSGSRSSQRGNSTHSSSPFLSTAAVANDLTFQSVIEPPPVKRGDKKPKEMIMMEEHNNNPLVLFPFSNDRCLQISTSTIALHARAPGPKHRIRARLNTTTSIIHDQYQYDMWADHLSGIDISEIWNSFFVMGPLSFIAKSQPESVSSPHKGD